MSIIIPAYNEEQNIRSGRLAEVREWLTAYPAQAELIVVDDGSQDVTAVLAEQIADRVISIPHSGKAAAIITGMKAAVNDIVLFVDMDQATPISEASGLIDAFNKSADIVIGSRGLLRRHAPWSRYVLSLGHVMLRRLLFKLPLLDTQCGFKACRRQVAEDILNRLHIYNPQKIRHVQGSRVNSGFDIEFLLIAIKSGYKIVDIAVQWNYRRTRKTYLFKEAWWGLLDLLYIARENCRGNYRRLN